MNEEDTPLYMSDEQIDRLRGIKRRTQGKHGTNLRGAFFWLIIASIPLGYLLYMRAMGLAMPDLLVWIVASFGFALAFIGLMCVCSEWRKEDE